MTYYAGTSGFAHPHWVGSFYDDTSVQSSSILSVYAKSIPFVELEQTFYRWPRPEVIEKWAAQTDKSFRITFAGLRRITHEKRLRDVEPLVQYFLNLVAPLEKRAGPVVYQLPAFFRKDVDRLEKFLAAHQGKIRVCMAFKHPSWFSNDVYAVLKNHNAALCFSDSPDAQQELVQTANWNYARLNKIDGDNDASLDAAVTLVKNMAPKGDMFVVVPPSVAGPTTAQRLQERLRA